MICPGVFSRGSAVISSSFNGPGAFAFAGGRLPPSGLLVVFLADVLRVKSQLGNRSKYVLVLARPHVWELLLCVACDVLKHRDILLLWLYTIVTDAGTGGRNSNGEMYRYASIATYLIPVYSPVCRDKCVECVNLANTCWSSTYTPTGSTSRHLREDLACSVQIRRLGKTAIDLTKCVE